MVGVLGSALVQVLLTASMLVAFVLVASLGFALFPVLAIAWRLCRNADEVADGIAAAAVGTAPSDGGVSGAVGPGDY